MTAELGHRKSPRGWPGPFGYARRLHIPPNLFPTPTSASVTSSATATPSVSTPSVATPEPISASGVLVVRCVIFSRVVASRVVVLVTSRFGGVVTTVVVLVVWFW
jgi:hypothetical protein